MTKLTFVNRNEQKQEQKHIKDIKLERRQILVELDDLPNIILKFEDNIPCLACETDRCENDRDKECRNCLKSLENTKSYLEFMNKLNKSFDTGSNCSKIKLESSSNEMMSTVGQLAPCLSCKMSVERLFKKIIPNDGFTQALDPIQINSKGVISLKQDLINPKSLYTLFYSQISEVDDYFEPMISNYKKQNKRCKVHSFDNQKQTKINYLDSWVDVWQRFESVECKNELLNINSNKLLNTINDYLMKNKYCSDCKYKVLVAFKLLTGEAEIDIDQSTFSPQLYYGILICNKNGIHLHVKHDQGYIYGLINNARAEILEESLDEKHATTLDAAQRVVLNCIGILLHERFLKIGETISQHENAWKLLFYSCLNTLKRDFKYKLEKFSDLETICAELNQIDTKKSLKIPKKTTKSAQKEANVCNKEKHTCYTSSKQTTVLMLAAPEECKDIVEVKFNKAICEIKEGSIGQESCSCSNKSEFIHEELKGVEGCDASCCFNIIEYWNRLVQEDLAKKENESYKIVMSKSLRKKAKTRDENQRKEKEEEVDEPFRITHNEKMDYFNNKEAYLNQRNKRRLDLANQFQKFKSSSNFRLVPRKTSN